MKRYGAAGACIALILLLTPCALAAQPLTDMELINIQDQIVRRIKESYVDTISTSRLWTGAIEGIVNQLDPHSGYMPPESYDDFSEKIQGNFQGIGITFAVIAKKITVIEVIAEGPSEKAGLRIRDKIVAVDGKSVIGVADDDVRKLLRGPADSQVQVQVERPGVNAPLLFTITRGNVALDSVSHAYMLDETTGYVSLTRFSLFSALDLQRSLAHLKGSKMKRLVLDLRNNSGGSLDAAIGIVDCFVREGTIVSTKGRRAGDNHTWTATGNAQYRDLPLVVMINHASASASEIVAGALQDHDRALVVGQTSFGKGLVMNPYELTLNRRELGTFMLTIARYYTPSGRLIQRPYDGTREEYLEEGLDDYDPNEEETSLADRPVFKTDLKRDVYGGGGITPDRKLSSPRRLNRLESDLRATNLLFEFADGYILRHTDIPREFSVFLASYHIPEDEFTRFKSFITDKNISLEDETTLSDDLKQVLTRYNLGNEQKTVEDALSARGVDFGTNLFEKSHGFIERELKMELARMLWGPEERYRVWHSDDTELIEAVGYFKDAEELLQRRLAIGNP